MQAMSRSVWLTIDIGNSTIKIGLFAEDRTLATVTESSVEEALTRITTWNTQTPPCRIGLCNVVPQQSEVLISKIAEFTDAPIFEVNSHAIFPIRLDYTPPENLGPDRLAAACAAWYPGGTSQIIIDAGTAITIDVVRADGSFLGGVIMPSPTLSNRALADYTAKLPNVSLTPPEGSFGTSTVEALQHGLIYGMIDGVLGTIARIEQFLDSPSVITLTGGWYQILAEHIPRAQINRNLVLHGIRLLMQFNPPPE
ncbi:MAG: type III pantothenate kinase [Rhodothermaceae bacterium]|nr:type III pantothenate kinase [Rhodothermaceae bacterium]MXW32084.1 type III pantothenate kinase [Rhodothermaceae bacterium]MXX97748.1 type III pantothenate kinase [Rhodothermaceae bacterium]MXZ18140.1 type III pantothenate kinase [Rhodothermaceae bacterium]MXZ57833.1 type III pantothenate kinase [Rhodothermaceae bacterium]